MKNKKLTELEFNELLKVIDFEELQKITMGNRKNEHSKFYEAAIKYGIVKGEKNE